MLFLGFDETTSGQQNGHNSKQLLGWVPSFGHRSTCFSSVNIDVSMCGLPNLSPFMYVYTVVIWGGPHTFSTSIQNPVVMKGIDFPQGGQNQFLPRSVPFSKIVETLLHRSQMYM
jgi:hypothetical protein